VAALTAVGELYHAWITGLILTTVTRLGLSALPPAVACAQYHYLSNDLACAGDPTIVWRIAR
jgi:hypothetical protein